MCALVQVCDAVHAGAHQELFCIDPLTHSATRKTNSKKMETAKPQKLRFGIFEDSQSSKLKIVASRILNRLRFDALLCSRSQSATRLPSRCFTFRRFPMHSHTDAQLGLLHLNSAPNEATTSIWLKAMMVCRDLRGNIEPSEMESGTEGEIGSPRGGAPRGKSGLILVAERSASVLYLRRNLHASWGIHLGDTESPCVPPSVSPCVSPRCRASGGRIGHHMSVLRAV